MKTSADNPRVISRTWRRKPSGTLCRLHPKAGLCPIVPWPICPSLSTAFFHGTDVAGYHVVNIIIHVITACLLFATVMKLFSTPRLTGIGRGDVYFIALLTAFLWAVNPIQTQAVTYIVQRMASMAAMFYLLAVYFYLSARSQENSGPRMGLLYRCAD